MRTVLLLLVLVSAAASRAAACPAGMIGPECGTCTTDAACATLSENPGATCYSNFTYLPDTLLKTYACTTEGTDLAQSVTNVWAKCYTDVEKCDVHFALGGHALTCSGLQCNFDDSSVFCGYTRCQCDESCPIVNGVSLGYMLERLTGQTVMECDDATGMCAIDIQGLSATEGGFMAYCKAGECRDY